MKKIGLIGGTSPESTLLYYSHLIELSRNLLEKDVYPEIVIYSVNFKEAIDLMRSGKRKELAEKFSEIFKWMEKIGVEIGALTANTMHIVFDMIETGIELVHIVESVAKEARRRSYEKLVIFGTRLTMESDMYPKILESFGIETLIPEEDDRKRIDEIIFNHLVQGNVNDEIKDELRTIALKYLKDADAVVLGCTELPLVMKDIGIDYIDSTEVHAKDIFERAVRS